MLKQLSGNYGTNRMDLVKSLNRQIAGWARLLSIHRLHGDPILQARSYRFLKTRILAARKCRRGFRSLMRDHVRAPKPGQAKTWVLQGRNSRGWYGAVALRHLITSSKGRFTWRSPLGNPYIMRDKTRRTSESRYADVAFAMSDA